jgi:hypothetical protein
VVNPAAHLEYLKDGIQLWADRPKGSISASVA